MTNPFVLIQAIWMANTTNTINPNPKSSVYQLLGLGEGTRPNSGNFFESLHTLGEISEFLTMRGMVLHHTKFRWNRVPLKNSK